MVVGDDVVGETVVVVVVEGAADVVDVEAGTGSDVVVEPRWTVVVGAPSSAG